MAPLGYYPALPEPKQINPLVAGGAGVALGQDIGGTALQQQGQALALDVARQKQQSLKQFAETQDISKLAGYSPEVWLKATEDQRKKISEGIDLVGKMTPYLTSSDDPRTFAAAADDLEKAGAPKSITQPLRNPDINQARQYADRLSNHATQMEADRLRTLGPIKTDIEVAGQKKLFEKVEKPKMEMQNQFSLGLLGQRMNFDAAQATLQRKFLADLEGMKDQKAREQFTLNDFTRQDNEINKSLLKAETEIRKSTALMSEEKEPAIAELRRQAKIMRNKIIDNFKPITDQYKIPFPFQKEEVPEPAGVSTVSTSSPAISPADATAELRRRGVIK